MKIIYLAYREWAKEVYKDLKKHPKVSESIFCETESELLKLDVTTFDLLVTCGWSDELPESIARNIVSIGVHCAELDRYSYGSPLQLQIIDGLKRTKHRIFSFTNDPTSRRAHTHNRLYSHEVILDLTGGMEQVLGQMTATSKVLFNWFLDDYPSIEWREWPEEDLVRPKRKPEDSGICLADLQSYTAEELYNFFRCLEAPYPNGFIYDNTGKLFIEKVRFKISDGE